MIAPIVLFVYNRPEHTRKTLEILEKNDLSKESELFIYADGPKEGASKEQMEKITETRQIIREKKWCGKVNIIERNKNIGLANSVIAGVTEIVNKFGKIVVLEDDLLLSKNFLKYMNDALDKFENEEKVMQIAGYMFPVETCIEKDTFFLPFTSSWGWGTWKRAWDSFDTGMKGLEILKKDAKLRKSFDLNGSYPYYKMLLSQKGGKIDSWAIRFYLSIFLNDGLVVFPKKTLVSNIGFDGSGVHCKNDTEQPLLDDSFEVKSFPERFAIDEKVKNKIYHFFKKQNSIIVIISNFLRNKLKNIC